MKLSDLSSAQLRRAASLQEQIESLTKELSSILGTASPAPTTAIKTRTISAAGIARIKAAQKLRWAKIKAAAPATTPKKKKFTMSASAKAAISKAAKARWAKIRAAKQ